ncbi:MAG: right-handed parallel beta-helix repeat-containing protein [Thermoplasmatota archaeon]
MRISAVFVWAICLFLIGMWVLIANEVKAQTVITVGPNGDFLTIEAATDWVTTDNSDTFYTITVMQDYNPAQESFPIIINMQVGDPLKNVEIVGYPTSITLGPVSPSVIFDVCFDMGLEYELIITNFNLVVKSMSFNVIYIHDSTNVIISQNQIGGSSNYHCKNGIYAVDSDSLRFNDLTINYCHEDGIRMFNVDNLDNQNIYRGVDHCDILTNDDDGLDMEICTNIRVADTYFRYNGGNGIKLSNSDDCLFLSEPMYTINDNCQSGIHIYGACDSNVIREYNIYDNDVDGILFYEAIPYSSSNRNIVENVVIYGNDRDGIGIRNSAYINIIEENTRIYDNDVGIFISDSHDVRIDLDKMDIIDPSSLYSNNYGIFCNSSYYLDIGNIILSNNRLGMNYHSSRGEPEGFEANVAVLSCYDFYIWDYIFIIGHDSGSNGIFTESCHVQNYARNIISLVRLLNFDVNDYWGMILSSTTDTYVHFYKDLDGLTEHILYVRECFEILVEDIDFEREEDTNAIGIIVESSCDIVLITSEEGESYGYGDLFYYAEGIKISGSYNVEINNIDISYCNVGIGIHYGYWNYVADYYNIDIIDVHTYECDYGVWVWKMFDSTAGVAVEIIDLYVEGSEDYGIVMQGSEVTLDNTDVYGYGTGGVYNKYAEEDDQYYPGYLIVESDCVITDNGENPDIITEGYSLNCKAESYDYYGVSQHVEIGNLPDYEISVYRNI